MAFLNFNLKDCKSTLEEPLDTQLAQGYWFNYESLCSTTQQDLKPNNEYGYESEDKGLRAVYRNELNDKNNQNNKFLKSLLCKPDQEVFNDDKDEPLATINTEFGEMPLPKEYENQIPMKFYCPSVVNEREIVVKKIDRFEKVIEVPHVHFHHNFTERPIKMQIQRIVPNVVKINRNVPKIVEKHVVNEKIIEVPQGVKYVEVPIPVNVKPPPRIIEKPMTIVVDRIIESVKPVVKERIIEIPRVEYRKIPKKKIVEIPYFDTKYVEKTIYTPLGEQNLEIPIVTKDVKQNIDTKDKESNVNSKDVNLETDISNLKESEFEKAIGRPPVVLANEELQKIMNNTGEKKVVYSLPQVGKINFDASGKVTPQVMTSEGLITINEFLKSDKDINSLLERFDTKEKK